MDTAVLDLYSRRLKELGALVREDRPLPASVPTPGTPVRRGQARQRGRLCGSEVDFTVTVDAAGRLVGLGWQVRACALAAAAAGLVAEAGPGSDLGELRAVRDAVKTMLKQGDAAPLPGGKWQDLEVLRPAHQMPSRRGSALLAFDVVVEAMENAAAEPRADQALP